MVQLQNIKYYVQNMVSLIEARIMARAENDETPSLDLIKRPLTARIRLRKGNHELITPADKYQYT